MKETRKPKRFVTLIGLPDVARKKTKSVGATSVSDAVYWLRRKYPIAAAGDHGAISAWKDKFGRWRCEFYQFRVAKDSQTYRYLADVQRWLKRTWPQMKARRP